MVIPKGSFDDLADSIGDVHSGFPGKGDSFFGVELDQRPAKANQRGNLPLSLVVDVWRDVSSRQARSIQYLYMYRRLLERRGSKKSERPCVATGSSKSKIRISQC